MAAILGATTLAVAATFCAAAPAQVGGGDVNCTGTQVTTYDPDLVLTERPVKVHLTRQFAPCVSLSNPR